MHQQMLTNLFKCPIELFEAYPIGKLYIGQVRPDEAGNKM
jgi:hypothetical protein